MIPCTLFGRYVALSTLLVACGARTSLNDPPDASAEDVVVTVDVPDVPLPPPPPDVPPPPPDVPPPPPDVVMPIDIPPACPPGRERCDGVCVDTVANNAHCGGCFRRCGGGMRCVANTCVPACEPPTPTLCIDRCVDVRTDPLHCGQCGNSCPSGLLCANGQCLALPMMPYTRILNPRGLVYADVCRLAGAITYLNNIDDSRTEVLLPFAFRYWGVSRAAGSRINLTTNGWIGLDDGTSASLGGMIPSSSVPNAVVAAYWRDTRTTAAGICVVTLGDAPNRRIVFDWHQMTDLGFTNEVSFNVVLHEGNNVIDLVYGRMIDPQPATVGLENQLGTQSVSGCPSETTTRCAPMGNTSVRFVPSP